MSYTLPRPTATATSPSSTYSSYPSNRNDLWSASRRARLGDSASDGHVRAQSISAKLGNVFEDVGLSGKGRGYGLPMYKDKPYNYAGSGRRRIWLRQRGRVLGGLLLAALGFAWWLGLLPDLMGSRTKSSRSGSGKGGWVSGGWDWKLSDFTSKKPLDWPSRQAAVKSVFLESWTAYETHAWGADEFHPISKQHREMVPGGLGWIIIDALDTLMLMNLTTQLVHAREWISESLDYEKDARVNTFETTIRMLGGLLGAQYLSTEFPNMAPVPGMKGAKGQDLYLEKATDLADRLLGAFESASGLAYAEVHLKSGKGYPSSGDAGASSTAEAGSLQLEMKYLAKLTGEKLYWDKAEKVMQVIDDNGATDGLVPIFMEAEQGTFRGVNIRLGSRGDSYYEYLIKQYLQTSTEEPVYLSMWEQALLGVEKHLIAYSHPSNLTFIAERPQGLDKAPSPKMDHLVCFMPGTIALAATGGVSLAEARIRPGWGEKQEREMELARELTKTCWGMYKVTKTGLAPEIAHFEEWKPGMMMSDFASSDADYPLPPSSLPSSPTELRNDDPSNAPAWHKDYVIKRQDSHNLQRPETVESLFYMYRITGDEVYREWGWEMFCAFVVHMKITPDDIMRSKKGKSWKDGKAMDDEAEIEIRADELLGYTSLHDVTEVPAKKRDNMESFWLAETLKYFYLLFGPPDLLSLDRIVFNTEAHPFPRFELGQLFTTGWARKPRDAHGNILPDPVPVVSAEAQAPAPAEVEHIKATSTVLMGAETAVPVPEASAAGHVTR